MVEASEPVVVLAPTGRDGALISEALQSARVRAKLCPGLDQFASSLQAGAAAGLMAEEALGSSAQSVLSRVLSEQPPWSDLPLILLTTRRKSDPAIGKLLADGVNISMLERPIRMQTLVSAVMSALRQRQRQYELRERLAAQHRTDEHMRQTQKLESLGVLAGGIAHDFNNLLTGIIGNISLALDDEPNGTTRRRYLQDAIDASERAADLTRQLLAYSGKGQFAIQSLDLSEAVRQISTLIQTSIPKNVQVSLNLTPELPAIQADPTQIQQIVMNLIINAAEAIDPDASGLVIVQTGLAEVTEDYLRQTMAAESAEAGKFVYVEVRDNGCGIEPSSLHRIFDPFFTTKFLGRGLGLAAVLGIVRGHHGALRVDSTPGLGSAFRVLFPASQTAVAATRPETASHDLSGSGTVLVVDDEEIVRKLARNALERRGYHVLTAENGQIAVDLFQQAHHEIGLVLLDLTMPVMNGEQALQHLQRIRPDIKVILTSGYDEANAMARFQGAGLAAFVQKPYTAAQLAETVKRVFQEVSG